MTTAADTEAIPAEWTAFLDGLPIRAGRRAKLDALSERAAAAGYAGRLPDLADYVRAQAPAAPYPYTVTVLTRALDGTTDWPVWRSRTQAAAATTTGGRPTSFHRGSMSQDAYEAQLRGDLPRLRETDPARAAYVERMFPWWADEDADGEQGGTAA